jgi:Spy/CpxP family protein refolding chaperone
MFQLLTLSLFVAMVAISPLLAGDGCQEKAACEKKLKAEGCEKMKAEGCMMLKQIPNLSDEQKGKLEKLCMEHQKMMTAAKAEMEKQALEMQVLMKDPVDVKKIEAKIDEMAMMKAGMQKKCLAHCLAVRALLTVEQKAKCEAMGCGMMGGMGMMGGKCGMKEHGMKKEHGKCQKAEEEKKEEKK